MKLRVITFGTADWATYSDIPRRYLVTVTHQPLTTIRYQLIHLFG